MGAEAAGTSVVCLLPSGVEIVTTIERCKAAGGTWGSKVNPTVVTPTPGEADELFLCRTQGGDEYMATFAECQQDDGIVLGKIEGRTKGTGPA